MEINFTWVGGATFVIETGGLRIACDPSLAEEGTIADFFWFKSVRLNNPVYDQNTFNNIDMWLLTHAHLDHLDKSGMAAIGSKSIKIGTKEVARCLVKNGLSGVEILEWGELRKYSFGSVKVEVMAVPAIHGINPVSAFFAGKVNGYLLKIIRHDSEFTTYITGDTVYDQRIFKKVHFPKIDLMIPNMGAAQKGSWIMNLTLDAKMLRRLIAKMNPDIVIPVHFEAYSHYNESIKATASLKDNRIKILNPGEKVTLKH